MYYLFGNYKNVTANAIKIEKKIILIDGEQLAQLMIDHSIGVAGVARYTVQRVDLDYFDEEQ